MLVTKRGIVIIMTNPQKTVFLIKKVCIYAKKKKKHLLCPSESLNAKYLLIMVNLTKCSFLKCVIVKDNFDIVMVNIRSMIS